MDRIEAITLFHHYYVMLNKSFHTGQELLEMRVTCEKIAEALKKIGFEIITTNQEAQSVEVRNEENEEEQIIEIKYTICLVPCNATNRTPIAVAEVCSQIYDTCETDTADGQEEKIVAESCDDIRFLQEANIAPASMRAPRETLWQRTWTFTAKDQCAFLAAFERHWNEWEVTAHRQKISADTEESVRLLIHTCRQMAPAGEHDVLLFSFLAEEELRRLRRWPEEELPCGCKAEEHSAALSAWIARNVS